MDIITVLIFLVFALAFTLSVVAFLLSLLGLVTTAVQYPETTMALLRRLRTLPWLVLLGLLVGSCACASSDIIGLLQLLKK